MSDKEYNLYGKKYGHKDSKKSKQIRHEYLSNYEKVIELINSKNHSKPSRGNIEDIVNEHKELRKRIENKSPEREKNINNLKIHSSSSSHIQILTTTKIVDSKIFEHQIIANDKDLAIAENKESICSSHKLVSARQQEKENAWKNYIKKLREKHMGEANNVILIEYQHAKNFDTNKKYNTKSLWTHSTPRKTILDDLKVANKPLMKLVYKKPHISTTNNLDNYIVSQRNINFYPKSSKNRLSLSQRELSRQEEKNCFDETCSKENIILSKMPLKRVKRNFKSLNSRSRIDRYCENTIEQRTPLQYDKSTMVEKEYNSRDTLTKSNQGHDTYIEDKTALSIENKLDFMIESLFKFMNDMKSNKVSLESINVTNKRNNIIKDLESDKKNNTNKDLESNKKKNINKDLESNKKNNNNKDLKSNKKYNINKDFESDKLIGVDSELVTRNIYYDKETSEFDMSIPSDKDKDHIFEYTRKSKETFVDFKLEIPTKDVCTALSKPFSRHNVHIAEDMNILNHLVKKNSNRAVNTDPVSLLGLVKISADSIKEYLSFLSNTPSYLPKLVWRESRDVKSIANTNNFRRNYISNRQWQTYQPGNACPWIIPNTSLAGPLPEFMHENYISYHMPRVQPHMRNMPQ